MSLHLPRQASSQTRPLTSTGSRSAQNASHVQRICFLLRWHFCFFRVVFGCLDRLHFGYSRRWSQAQCLSSISGSGFKERYSSSDKSKERKKTGTRSLSKSGTFILGARERERNLFTDPQLSAGLFSLTPTLGPIPSCHALEVAGSTPLDPSKSRSWK